MIVYSVEGTASYTVEYFATVREARREARRRSRVAGEGISVSVTRCALVPMTRGNVLRILNQLGGYVAEAETVAEYSDGRQIAGGGAR